VKRGIGVGFEEYFSFCPVLKGAENWEIGRWYGVSFFHPLGLGKEKRNGCVLGLGSDFGFFKGLIGVVNF
jgi:hypothetical protein